MEPVLFNKVFVNDDESLSSARVTNRPYQEILQAYPIQSDLDDYFHGDHSICFAFRKSSSSLPLSLLLRALVYSPRSVLTP